MAGNIKNIVKSHLPCALWNYMHNCREWVDVHWYRCRQKKTIRRISHLNRPINVLFIATFEACWKYDSVYRLMLEDANFNPRILICPIENRGKEFMLQEIHKCSSYFDAKKYTYVCAYDEMEDKYIDLRLQTDLVFFSTPYQGQVANQYSINNIHDVLSCFVNYSYTVVNHKWGVSSSFHQKLWRFFVECDDNKNLIKQYSSINNAVVTGYPMYDEFYYGTRTGCDWKRQDTKLKKIIWSPHHSVSNHTGMLQFSTFELYYDFMLNVAEKYRGKAQFVFKPHPLLKVALYALEGWGKERTDNYYNQWKNGDNTALVEGAYVDLFNSSDAMINDSGSFTIEYLYMRKPCLLLGNFNHNKDFNIIAMKAYDCWYHALTKEQIDDFIENIVIGGNDILKEKREQFYFSTLLPPNGCTVAENIVNNIKQAFSK